MIYLFSRYDKEIGDIIEELESSKIAWNIFQEKIFNGDDKSFIDFLLTISRRRKKLIWNDITTHRRVSGEVEK